MQLDDLLDLLVEDLLVLDLGVLDFDLLLDSVFDLLVDDLLLLLFVAHDLLLFVLDDLLLLLDFDDLPPILYQGEYTLFLLALVRTNPLDVRPSTSTSCFDNDLVFVIVDDVSSIFMSVLTSSTAAAAIHMHANAVTNVENNFMAYKCM